MKKLYNRLKFEEMPLEQFIFLIAAVSGCFTSIVGAVTNIPLGLGVIAAVVPAVNVFLCVGGIIYSFKTQKWVIPAILLVFYTTFVMAPMLWYTTGGATGSTMPYILVIGLVVSVMFKGKLRVFLIIAVPLIFAAAIITEMLYPDIIRPYTSRVAHYIDLSIGLVVSFIATAMLTISVLRRYHAARHEAEELVEKLKEVSITDSLTGIYNRRLLTSCLDEEMRSCYENNMPLSLCIIDVDHFKKVNDVYGHLRGDKVLIEIARILEKHIDDDDILGRYGGEEFLVILKNKTLNEALVTVENFHKAVQEREWEEVEKITISCGVSEYVKGISYSDFVSAADKLLYKAKQTGRNKIMYKKY